MKRIVNTPTNDESSVLPDMDFPARNAQLIHKDAEPMICPTRLREKSSPFACPSSIAVEVAWENA